MDITCLVQKHPEACALIHQGYGGGDGEGGSGRMEADYSILSCHESAALCSERGPDPRLPSIVMPQARYQVHLELVVKQIIYNISTALSLVW